VDVTVLRGIGAPFALVAGNVQSQIRVKVEDHAGQQRRCRIQLVIPKGEGQAPLESVGARAIIAENPIVVPALGRRATSLFVLTPPAAFERGILPIVVRVEPEGSEPVDVPYRLLGPETAP
jgi:hypothetical protein